MKKRLVALFISLIFSLSIVSPIFAADENSSATSTASSQTEQKITYDTTASTTYQTTYSTIPTTSSSTYSTTYGSTYTNTGSVVIPPISDDNLNIKEPEKLTKEQKQKINELIRQINQLKTKFNKLNAEVNYIRAKINKYIQAVKSNDRNFFYSELQNIIKSADKVINQLQKELKNKNLKQADISKYNKQLTERITQINAIQEKYQKEMNTTVQQAVYQIKALVDQTQPAIKDKLNQINAINEQIKAKSKEYEQAKKANDYNKMVASLNDLITLYQQKVDKITEVKNLYSNLVAQIESILKSYGLKFGSSILSDLQKNQNKEQNKEQEKNKNQSKNKELNKNREENKNVEINIDIKVPQNGGNVKINSNTKGKSNNKRK